MSSWRDNMGFKKISIFPINHKTVPLIRFAHLNMYEPIALVSPDLNMMDGNDISKLDGGPFAYMDLHIDYEKMINKSDIVYLLNSDTLQSEKLYSELIEIAKKSEKEIVISNEVARRFSFKLSTH